MVVGNVGALMQTNVKRLLGYSSIGHAGYALLGLLAYGDASGIGLWSILVYLLAYAFMNLGAFGLVILLESKGYAGESVDDFNGLAPQEPVAGRRDARLPALARRDPAHGGIRRASTSCSRRR